MANYYGNNPSLITEKSKPKPISLYSKLCLKYENYLKKQKKISFTILRLGTLYGWSKRMRYDLAINKIIRDCGLLLFRPLNNFSQFFSISCFQSFQ